MRVKWGPWLHKCDYNKGRRRQRMECEERRTSSHQFKYPKKFVAQKLQKEIKLSFLHLCRHVETYIWFRWWEMWQGMGSGLDIRYVHTGYTTYGHKCGYGTSA